MARTGVIYGPTGSYKTAQAKWFAHYIAEKTGKATALFSADGGGWDACQQEVDVGMIIPFRCDMSVAPMPLIRAIGQGMWPQDPKVTNPREINMRQMNWDEVGGYVIEGWTSISAVAMRYLPDNNVNVGGEDRSKLGGWNQPIRMDNEMNMMSFRSNTRGDYGFVQNFTYGFTMQAAAFPCEYVLFTALENKSEDEDKRVSYGPAIAGKKATSECGAWVGDMIHACDFVKYDTANQKPGEPPVAIQEVRYYYERHLDPITQITFPAKPRIVPEILPALRRRFPGSYFIPTINGKDTFAEYLRVVDSLRRDEKVPVSDTMTAWREKMDAKRRGKGATVAVPAAPAAQQVSTGQQKV